MLIKIITDNEVVMFEASAVLRNSMMEDTYDAITIMDFEDDEMNLKNALYIYIREDWEWVDILDII